ncbi:hypothetical protein F8M41_019884 [Gigaspora margarita]|uniref:Uncharacterized protein n=1 Tax=Gigaspora margarita TaxID=4874 RepID=A0A8H4EKA2_GIGMA|nr:hypothetical protein F8M41_019884 [Gigaspora margarita]
METSVESPKPFKFDDVIDVETKETKSLKLEDYIIECRFYNRDFLIVCHDDECNILKFSNEKLKNQKWKLTDSIYCGAWDDIINCHINAKEKIMLHDRCGSLTQWRLNTLFEKQYQLDITRFRIERWHCIFNKNSTLLAVYLEEYIYVYLTENSILLSHCKVKKNILKLEFISLDEGEERLLLFFENDDLEIRDPYDLQPDSEKTMDQIFTRKIKNYYRIRALPTKSQIVEFLQKYEGGNYVGSKCDGSLVKWEVSNQRVIQAFLKEFNSNTWESIDCVKLNHKFINLIGEINGCDLLYNEDLIMFTSKGLFIWSIWQKYKKIRLRYFIRKDRVEDIKAYEKNLLPAPDFIYFILHNEQSYTEDNRYLFEELLNDYIDDNILMKLYGKELLKSYLTFKNYSYTITEKLFSKIFKEIEDDNFLVKIQSFDIVTFLFTKLTQFP